jgi:hypothetical protein
MNPLFVWWWIFQVIGFLLLAYGRQWTAAEWFTYSLGLFTAFSASASWRQGQLTQAVMRILDITMLPRSKCARLRFIIHPRTPLLASARELVEL